MAARREGTSGEEGISLFVVPADSPGVERRALPTMDQTRRQAEIALSGVRVPAAALLGDEGAGLAPLEKTLDLAAVALSAEQVGGAQRCLDMAVAYAKERVQFGRPIGSFQAIKHKCANMMVEVESARSASYYAGCVAAEDGDELPVVASLAKAYCSDAYFRCAADSLQIHGGVGFTWEYDVHLYFKRAKSTRDLPRRRGLPPRAGSAADRSLDEPRHDRRRHMRDPLELSGKVVIVTGGSQGVGRGITTRFLEAGAEVVICDIKEPEELPVGRRASGPVHRRPTFATSSRSRGSSASPPSSFGRLDVLVNNAGGAPVADAATASPRFSEAIIRLNLIAPLLFAQQANAVMQQQEEGGVDHQHRECQRDPPLAGHGRLRRGQGGPALA